MLPHLRDEDAEVQKGKCDQSEDTELKHHSWDGSSDQRAWLPPWGGERGLTPPASSPEVPGLESWVLSRGSSVEWLLLPSNPWDHENQSLTQKIMVKHRSNSWPLTLLWLKSPLPHKPRRLTRFWDKKKKSWSCPRRCLTAKKIRFSPHGYGNKITFSLKYSTYFCPFIHFF